MSKEPEMLEEIVCIHNLKKSKALEEYNACHEYTPKRFTCMGFTIFQ